MIEMLLRVRSTLRPVVYTALSRFSPRMHFPPYSPEVQHAIDSSADPVRYGAIALALTRIQAENIPGALAELGVWRGETSEFIQTVAPEIPFYLFDTFAGFPGDPDKRFRDTSLDAVRERLNHSKTAIFRVGAFPGTAQGLENERFSFVMFDADKFQVAVDALEFFYPRLNRGGYFFLHDFNSTESDLAVRRATLAFLLDKPELPIELSDAAGSVVFRKI